MSALSTALLLLAAGWMNAIWAHDIGVSESELLEQPGSIYTLSVRSGVGASHLFPAPVLPGHCEFIGNPRGAITSAWKTFEFSCSDGLTATDTLELAWRRDGIMLAVRWADGSTVKRLFRSEAGRIVVSLAEAQAGSGSWVQAAQRYAAPGHRAHSARCGSPALRPMLVVGGSGVPGH